MAAKKGPKPAPFDYTLDFKAIDFRQRPELYQVGKLQQSSLDYEAAWKSFESGLQAAEVGGQLAKLTGQLDKERRRIGHLLEVVQNEQHGFVTKHRGNAPTQGGRSTVGKLEHPADFGREQ